MVEIAVTISGQAWRAMIWPDAPHELNTDVAAVTTTAVVRKRGLGESVTLTGPPDTLERMAWELDSDGSLWLCQCDTPHEMREARACVTAAAKIRDAINKATN